MNCDKFFLMKEFNVSLVDALQALSCIFRGCNLCCCFAVFHFSSTGCLLLLVLKRMVPPQLDYCCIAVCVCVRYRATLVDLLAFIFVFVGYILKILAGQVTQEHVQFVKNNLIVACKYFELC